MALGLRDFDTLPPAKTEVGAIYISLIVSIDVSMSISMCAVLL